jgi:hypothetical protein
MRNVRNQFWHFEVHIMQRFCRKCRKALNDLGKRAALIAELNILSCGWFMVNAILFKSFAMSDVNSLLAGRANETIAACM